MILADKIIEERKKLGLSQEELADRLGVSRQAVSKWESAQSTPDLQRVLALADIFGVTTDYLLREDASEPESVSDTPCEGTERVRNYTESTEKLHRVSMEEANAFLHFKRRSAPRIALGVALCIFSPAVMILLLGLAEYESRVSEGTALGLGMAVLLCAVAAGVYLFIRCGIEGRHFAAITEGRIDTAYGVTGMVKEQRQSRETVYTNCLVLGVILCILSAVPLVVAAVMGAEDTLVLGLTALLLVFVAVGVYLIVSASVERGGYSALLEEGDYTPEAKEIQKTQDNFGGIYWSAVTAGYLLWSFLSGAWHITWVVWPVAGILFGAIAAIVRAVKR